MFMENRNHSFDKDGSTCISQVYETIMFKTYIYNCITVLDINTNKCYTNQMATSLMIKQNKMKNWWTDTWNRKKVKLNG